jgi:hypothetical protein
MAACATGLPALPRYQPPLQLGEFSHGKRLCAPFWDYYRINKIDDLECARPVSQKPFRIKELLVTHFHIQWN